MSCALFADMSQESKTPKPARLRLDRETFRRLTTDELSTVDGGYWSSTGPEACTCSVTFWESITTQGHLKCKTAAP